MSHLGARSLLVGEPKKDKERLKTLEKSIDTKKAFSKLKEKQIDEALIKVEKAGSETRQNSRLWMSTRTSFATITGRVSTFFLNTWPSIA